MEVLTKKNIVCLGFDNKDGGEWDNPEVNVDIDVENPWENLGKNGVGFHIYVSLREGVYIYICMCTLNIGGILQQKAFKNGT